MPTNRQRQTTGSVQPSAAPSKSPGGEVVFYRSPDGMVRLDVQLTKDTGWLSLTQMAELFGRDRPLISQHLRIVFTSGELEREATVAKDTTITADRKTGHERSV
ncbi:hypothetical protein [Candidatus Nitrospira neomarina]|uniref:Uncharacterized protein n=1 Tax=Candidatus Nitrospira neomarina TaxID=3020899 RepID=A0AA96GFH5_9BACT|nr:hypothetical protein [Candidatus Nitrospira neomarina]WNM60187.1 hypothetical protein PQG83_10450 [Candidatus Nitrospira neomarina]